MPVQSRLVVAGLAMVGLFALRLRAQTEEPCVPVEERAAKVFGCFITVRDVIGPVSSKSPVYWYLHTYPTLAAARAARGPRGTVVESLGRIWLFTIADADFRPIEGKRVARIGPLPIFHADQFAAVYMENVFEPGMTSPVHSHPGVEALYTVDGSMCVETPSGRRDQRAGGPGVVVPGNTSMILNGTGKGIRRSIVLILQDATVPLETPVTDWTPVGLCRTPPR
jgi:quercetin dioxygenase-like cupin family protein